jgi:signal-transduction protein with cAMP-binding, CBS, and nucleotidyltransferase domain
MAQKVRDIMSGPPVTVSPDTDLATAAKKMRDENVGAILVTEGDDLTGVVTDRDLVVRGLADAADPKSKLGGIVSHDTATVGPDDDLDKAVSLMRERAVRRLPVVENGRPVGIVSMGDLALEKDERSALADVSAAKPNR